LRLQEANRRQEKIDAIGYLQDIDQQDSLSMAEQLRRQEEEDEREVQRLCGKTIEGKYEKRLDDSALSQEEPCSSSSLREEVASFASTSKSQPQSSMGIMSMKPQQSKRASDSQAKLLGGIVIKKKK